MKKVIYNAPYMEDGAPIVAMATINPSLCKQLGIEVEVEQRNEGPIPHLHVYHDSTRDPRKCSYVRLDEGTYSNHHKKKSPKMPRKVKDAFICVMESRWERQVHISPSGNMRVATGYEGAVDTWVDTYENGDYSKFQLDMEVDPVMPDYSNL